ncbi:carbon-monoxide dehydrogenase medium subunit [Streptosporangium subroseum]|uniref:Carbon-monoxide dehydrogenase medium subunit n=1 Tax=Streptosporangium subroseum TaxID=106412 RepID=A0A239I5V9_9ACTN|nr:FAD binding domain-containing protein [Streptosporangium subroseum]SNS88473.1 carbon-monoxide dehydrogenase medium subunit [Streptosporangium subroseum]
MTILDRGLPSPGVSPDPMVLLTPRSLDEALHLLTAEGAAVLGGGVGHTLRRHDRHRRDPTSSGSSPERDAISQTSSDPPHKRDATSLVSVGSLPELRTILWSGEHVTIGAGVRLGEIEADERLVRTWPIVTEAAGSVATGRIRRLVTLGGNVAAGDDSHDLPVALAAAGAVLTVRSVSSTRTLRIGEVNDLGGDELIQDVRLPIPSGRAGSAYEKFLSRGVWEYACVNVGAVVRLDDAGAARRLSLAVGSVTGGPVVIDLADLRGSVAGGVLIDEVARRAAASTRPYGDVKGSAEYKTRMIAEFSRRAMTGAVRRAEETPRSGGEST